MKRMFATLLFAAVLMMLALPAAAQSTDATVTMTADGDCAAVTLTLPDGQTTGVTSLSLSFDVQTGDNASVKFVFDSGLKSTVQEYRYNASTGRLVIYLSGRQELFKSSTIALGEISLHSSQSLTATVSVVEDSLQLANSAFGTTDGIDISAQSVELSVGNASTPEDPSTGGDGSSNTDGENSSDPGSSDQGSSDQGSSDQDSSNQGSSDQDSSNQGSSNQGASNQGASNQGSSNQGSTGQNSSGGSSNQATESASNTAEDSVTAISVQETATEDAVQATDASTADTVDAVEYAIPTAETQAETENAADDAAQEETSEQAEAAQDEQSGSLWVTILLAVVGGLALVAIVSILVIRRLYK